MTGVTIIQSSADKLHSQVSRCHGKEHLTPTTTTDVTRDARHMLKFKMPYANYRRFSTLTNALTASAITVVLFILATGCIHNPALTTSQNLILTADKSIAVLAQVNKGVASSAVSLSSIMPNVPVREILEYNHEVDNVILACNTALTSGGSPAVVTLQMLSALQSIKQLPPGVQTFVSTPSTRQEILTLVSLLTSVVTLVQGLISSNATLPSPPITPSSPSKAAPTKTAPPNAPRVSRE